MASTRPHSKIYDLDITIVSAKHLKNVNWRHGDLKPYCIFWVDPDRRLATKSDDSGSTQPVWNERFIVPLSIPPQESLLVLEIFHSKPSETSKPLVGTLRLQIKDLIDSEDSAKIKVLELRRPSGRPQGKIRLKLSLRERPMPDYQINLPSTYYYNPPSQPPLPAFRDFRAYSPPTYLSLAPPPPPAAAPPPPSQSPPPPPPPPPLSSHSYQHSGYSDPYSSYYSGYYSHQPVPPPPPPRPFFERHSSYGAPPGPSAPVDYASSYDQMRGGKMGLGTGLAVGAVAGALGGLALEEGLKYEEDKIAEKLEHDLGARDEYSDY